MEAWAHTGTMVEEEAVATREEVGAAGGSKVVKKEGEEAGAAGGSKIVEEGEGKKAGGVMVEREEVWEDLLVTSSEDSEDDPIVKEEAGVAPRLLLNPYFVE